MVLWSFSYVTAVCIHIAILNMINVNAYGMLYSICILCNGKLLSRIKGATLLQTTEPEGITERQMQRRIHGEAQTQAQTQA